MKKSVLAGIEETIRGELARWGKEHGEFAADSRPLLSLCAQIRKSDAALRWLRAQSHAECCLVTHKYGPCDCGRDEANAIIDAALLEEG